MIRTLIIILISALLFASCSSSSYLNGTLKGVAIDYQNAYNVGDYKVAFPVYKEIAAYYEQKGKTAPDSIYEKAGISALKIDSLLYAKKYLEKIAYKDEANTNVLAHTSMMYRGIDNLSKEIRFLELYFAKNPEGPIARELQTRFFMTYVESENVEQGLALWNSFTSTEKNSIPILEGYVLLNALAENTTESDKAAKQLLQQDQENTIALEYMANKHYRQAEDLYVKEMNAYKDKRTNKQYKILLKALKQATKDFKQSRDYYELLYTKSPDKKAAKRLSNIYKRLENEKKSDYYKKLSL